MPACAWPRGVTCFNHAQCGSKLPRAADGAARCTGGACKRKLTAQRKEAGAAPTEGLEVKVAQAYGEEMPNGMSVHEIEEIIGERCCKPTQMTKKQRKNGPGNGYKQQYLVRGTFLQPPDDDEDDEEDDAPEPDTFWVDQDVLLESETIQVSDVKSKLKARLRQLLEGL